MKSPICFVISLASLAASAASGATYQSRTTLHPERGLLATVAAEQKVPATKFRVEEHLISNRLPHRVVEKEKVAFLGVETVPVTPVLIAQLNLPNKAGLVVRQVVPDSPAAGALQEHDILLRLDDQILVDQQQLGVLVRGRNEGDEVTLTYLRGGKQATAKVKLVIREMPKLSLGESDLLVPGRLFGPMLPHLGEKGAALGVTTAGDGRQHVIIQQGPGTTVRAVRIDTGNSSFNYTDDGGSLELTIKDGKKSLVAKDPKGEPQFSGPVDTDEQRKAMPASVRERLQKLEAMQDVTFGSHGFGTQTHVKTQPNAISLPGVVRRHSRVVF